MIYVLGAGKSSYYLLSYLEAYEHNNNRQLNVLDLKISDELRNTFPHINFIEGDLYSKESIAILKDSKVVVSFLPAVFHIKVAELCLAHGSHLVTASYVSEKFQELNDKAKDKGLLFLMEMGLDPGIDHMSAMQMVSDIKEEGYSIKSFKSYCGALISKEADDNPWHYKFTWNPMNVVLAGQTVAGYINGGRKKYLSSYNVFRESNVIKTSQGNFDGYYNRDSIAYRSKYNLEDVDTFIRGTLRGQGFCEAWQVLVDLGFTHHKTKIDVSGLSIKEVVMSFVLKRNQRDDLWESLANQVGDFSEYTQKCLAYLDFNTDKVLPVKIASPAEYLLHILRDKWKLEESDCDRIVLFHEIEAEKDGNYKTFNAVLDLEGESSSKTAIAKTVSLPAAIATKLIVEDKIELTGVHIPIKEEIYTPVLEELKEYGIEMEEF